LISMIFPDRILRSPPVETGCASMTEEQRYIVKASQTSGLGSFASFGAESAATKGSRIPPKWRGDTASRQLFPKWHKRLVCSAAAVTIPIWW
jgi:hypothetical protein